MRVGHCLLLGLGFTLAWMPAPRGIAVAKDGKEERVPVPTGEPGGTRSVDRARALDEQSMHLKDAGKPGEAEPLSRQALALRIHLLGEKHRDTIANIGNLAVMLDELGRSTEAQPFHRRALALNTEMLGEEHAATVASLVGLGFNLNALGRPREAERVYRRVLALRIAAFGEKHPLTISSTNDVAFTLNALGRSAEAEPLYRRALSLRIEMHGEKHGDTIRSLNNLAFTLKALGRTSEAEPLYRRAFALRTELRGEEHPDTLTSLNNLAAVLNALGRSAEAEPLYRRVLALRIKVQTERHPDAIRSLNNLAHCLNALDRPSDAETLYRRALALLVEVRGETHPATILTLNNLASTLTAQGRPSEAEPLNRRALELRTRLLGSKHPHRITSLHSLANTLEAADRLPEAEPLYRQALALRTQVLGRNHPRTILAGGSLAENLLRQPGRASQALGPARGAVAAIRSSSVASDSSVREEDQRSRDALSRRSYFALLADADWVAGQTRAANLTALRAEAFNALQDAMAGTTSQAVAMAAARRLAEETSPELGSLAVERQSLAEQWRANEAALTGSLADSGPDATARRDALRQEGEAIEAGIAEIDARLRKDAPGYFAATSPQPVPLDEARAVLGFDEAVLIVVPTSFGTHVLALTREGLQWTRSDVNADQIAAMVTKLRRDLDIPLPSPVANAGMKRFDRATAYRLYETLIKSMLPALNGKKQLFIAADGALASLPFSALVSEAPRGDDGDAAALRSTRWFADDFALVQIPSFQSLHFLRTYGKRSRGAGKSSFVGFGDPRLAGGDFLRGDLNDINCSRGVSPSGIAGPGVNRSGGGLANLAEIRRLCSLPETNSELETLREALNAPLASLYLRDRATESAVRTAPLASARIIAFATHGVIAGEIGGIAEPGLIFTPPPHADDADDGYLAASEITGLRLDADWVILSACNTAAGDGDGSPGLSGLARAFFYAGARNLLVSHWPVRDDVAPIITTATIKAQQDDPTITRAQALQTAIGKVREEPGWEHPSIWAPFTLVGDGV